MLAVGCPEAMSKEHAVKNERRCMASLWQISRLCACASAVFADLEKYTVCGLARRSYVDRYIYIQANEKSSGFQKKAYRDGVGSTLHDLADCETLRNSLFTPMT